jgi:hypothetical protein
VPREYRPLNAEREDKPDEQQEMFWKKEALRASHQNRSLSRLCSSCFRLITAFLDLTAERPTPFREPLQFIVMSAMGVISGTFPDTYGVFYMTVNG